MNDQTRGEAVCLPNEPMTMTTNNGEAGWYEQNGVLRAASLAAFAWLDHGFGTRLAGPAWPPAGAVATATLKQIHSSLVTIVECDSPGGVLGEGDGLITNRDQTWLAVRTADCASVILADPEHHVAAVIHAGWRGTVGRIVPEALDRMASRFGTRPRQVAAAIGPAIGACCFEVGPEVALEFVPWWPERGGELSGGSHARVDLPGTLVRQLAQAGVDVRNIARHPGCTRCDAERFHSFRRDRDQSGRMVTAAAIRARSGAT